MTLPKALADLFDEIDNEFGATCCDPIREALAAKELELAKARGEIEELMRMDYWQERHDIVKKECDNALAALATALSYVKPEKMDQALAEVNDILKKLKDPRDFGRNRFDDVGSEG